MAAPRGGRGKMRLEKSASGESFRGPCTSNNERDCRPFRQPLASRTDLSRLSHGVLNHAGQEPQPRLVRTQNGRAGPARTRSAREAVTPYSREEERTWLTTANMNT